MKKILVSFCFILFLLTPFFAQVSANPQDEFYKDAVNWYLKGYVNRLPQIKPYPVNVIEDILLLVIENGEENEQQKAEIYYKKFFDKKWHLALDTDFYARIYSLMDTENDNAERYDESYQLSSELELASDIGIKDIYGFGAFAGLRGQSKYISSSEVLPKFTSNSNMDAIEPFSFDVSALNLLLDFSAVTTVGNEIVFGSFGFNSMGYGLFPEDDLLLSPCGNQILHASFNYEGDKFQYVQLFGLTAAMNKNVNKKKDFSYDKFFTFHSLNVPLFENKLNISYFEAAVFGKGVQPSYLTPVPWAIVSMADGFNETVYAGLKLEYKPVKCFSWNSEFVLNDMKIKRFVKLKWNDACIRSAVKTGFTYSPFDSIASLITVDYTLVTPYTFNIYDNIDDNYNYRDYSNYGSSIGTDLLPNSDRVSMKIQFKPAKNLKIATSTLYSRHGNCYESLKEDEILTLDGSHYTYSSLGQTSNCFKSQTGKTYFLTQEDIMYTLQAGIDFNYSIFSRKNTEVSFGFGYTFEFIRNDGVDNAIYTGDYSTYSAGDPGVSHMLEDELLSWKEDLHDSYNHYFRAGVIINF